MAKDPAFLFYSSDFLVGVSFMSNEEVGKYIRLLCLQHQKGIIEKEDFESIVNGSKKIRDKFIETEEGFYNLKLDNEVKRRSLFTKSRRDNINKRYHKSTSVDTSVDTSVATTSILMETETETETETLNNSINTNTIKEDFGIEKKYRIEECGTFALNDPRWVKSNKATQAEVLLFNEHLERLGVYTENPLEYKKYFSNLKKKRPELLTKKYTIEERYELARLEDIERGLNLKTK